VQIEKLVLYLHGKKIKMDSRFAQADLLELLDQFPAVAIVGPRQVGKTTLALQLAQILGKESVYVDLENPRDAVKLSDPVLFFENNEDKCVILDEIQRDKRLFPILRSMIDKKRVPARFIVLGSASPDLIRDSSESLAGRIYYKELMPFNLLEIPADSDMNTLIIRGGFPDSLFAKSQKMSSRWIESFVQTYIERDLPLLGLPISPTDSRRILRMLAYLHGEQLNYASLSKSLGVSAPSVKKYVQFFQHAFLVDLLEPYTNNISKRLVKSPKLYIRDSGLANHFLGIETYNDLFAHPSVGNVWEGFVIQQIKSILPDNAQMAYYRTSHGAEIDVVISLPKNVTIGLEIKFSSTPKLTRGTYEAFDDLKLKHLYVIIPTEDSYQLKPKITVMGLKAFMEFFQSKFGQ
jgi:predicted AAA+ superfamily ATPase